MQARRGGRLPAQDSVSPAAAWSLRRGRAAPRRIAVLGRLRVERRANGDASSVMTGHGRAVSAGSKTGAVGGPGGASGRGLALAASVLVGCRFCYSSSMYAAMQHAGVDPDRPAGAADRLPGPVRQQRHLRRHLPGPHTLTLHDLQVRGASACPSPVTAPRNRRLRASETGSQLLVETGERGCHRFDRLLSLAGTRCSGC